MRTLGLLVVAALLAPASAAAEDLTVYSSQPLVGSLRAGSLDTVRASSSPSSRPVAGRGPSRCG